MNFIKTVGDLKKVLSVYDDSLELVIHFSDRFSIKRASIGSSMNIYQISTNNNDKLSIMTYKVEE